MCSHGDGAEMINIYTDGSCQGNPGKGGWAAVIVDDGDKRVLSGSEDRTTNNRMELMAAIRGLEEMPAGADATVVSDSEYLVKTMTRNWKRNANRDLWTRLDAAVSGRRVEWEWVRGHDGHPENEEANELAGREAGVLPTAPEGEEKGPGSTLTHLDQAGRAQMVDVGEKAVTQREAVARGYVSMRPETLELIVAGGFSKGDVLATARLAGIMAAKQTSNLIPLCHPLPLDQVTVELEPDAGEGRVRISATARTSAKTGVEMEALTAVSVAALTLYDMCKSVDRGMRIEAVRLVSKRGGRSGDIVLEE